MTQDVFLSAVKALTEGRLTLQDVFGTAESLHRGGGTDLALQLYQLWIGLNRDHHLLYAAHFNYAVTLSAAGRPEQAKASLEKAIELNPDFYPAYINLGGALEALGTPDAAVDTWNGLVTRLGAITGHGIRMKCTALKQIARVLEERQQIVAAENVLRQSLELDNTQRENAEHLLASRMVQCRWPVIEPFDGMDASLQMRSFSPLSLAAYTDDPLLHLASSWEHCNKMFGRRIPRLPPVQPAERTERTRLKIGYVSSDLKAHAVGYLIAEVFGLHDRAKVEIFAYYCGPAGEDPLKQRIRADFDHWIDITGMSDEAAANRIREDGIDILVDLNGHTKSARTRVFAMRPAPVNVNWLGYPGTMGTAYHHYIIADEWIIPPGREMYCSEKVVRLPCYQANDRKRAVASEPPSRTDLGLPEDAMVFCCFNSQQKISKMMFERWMHILNSVPGSVLWLLESGEEIQGRLWDHAERCGIARDRLIFGKRLASPDHLARMTQADLFLDTFPYGAHTTASDALWMSVPILTLSGRSFASRVGGSLSRSAGLPELVCSTPEEYVEMAIALGNDRTRLQAYRDQLRAAKPNAVMFDTNLLVSRLEDLYAGMWADFMAGRLPRPDLTNLDVYLDLGIEHPAETSDFASEDDYFARWRQGLAARDHLYPLSADSRLWVTPDTENG
ncbi:TPR domain protein putative component of TonB system [Paramagnetospirillum magnetotacticum MS-1]|uniref:protein O-GlcNAc transferase n=1 Tax=Paramagnetospirillum magnetotacticum MS-1 TaxID=272627 RepID=A0A0C2YPZ1_PARME|nr:tetratricopeptide repeat protein [Paramagnetospirillum magnetotacticum]KIL97178.1 TPR domain protein putative component of TonB system [Paramagnetospirillum magnetotacticum MS-1]